MRRLPATTVYYGLELFLRMPTWVVMAVFLVRELHLSPLQLVLMGTAMEASVFIFEVPTGVVADTYSRRLSLIVGYLGMGAAWMLVAVVSAPWAIILLWAFWGLSYTFTSGAYQAWITDEVGSENVGSLFLRGRRVGYGGALVGLIMQVAVGTLSLRAGVIAGGAVTFACGLACIVMMPETGFRRRPRGQRASALGELRATTVGGARFAWGRPIVLLLIGVELFMGMSSEAFDRLKEAHVLRDVGLPAVGHLDPVVWFGMFWVSGMALGFLALGRLIRRVERRGRKAVTHSLVVLTLMEMAAMLVFADGLDLARDRGTTRRLLRPRPGGTALHHLAQRADHRLERARHRAVDQRPGECDRSGRWRSSARSRRQRLGHPPGTGCRRGRDRARAHPVPPRDRPRRARAPARGAACRRGPDRLGCSSFEGDAASGAGASGAFVF
jgi:MFS transporter, DHA3 family, tetracycline resistance protein